MQGVVRAEGVVMRGRLGVILLGLFLRETCIRERGIREARILEGCVAVARVGIFRVVVSLLGMGRGLRGFGREDPVREASILEGVRGLGLVRRLGRNWVRLARSRTARLGGRLRLVALAWVLRRLRLVALPRVGLLGLRLIALLRLVILLRLRLIARRLRLRLIGLLGREGIGEVWCGVASRRGTRGLVGRSAILVRIARYAGL